MLHSIFFSLNALLIRKLTILPTLWVAPFRSIFQYIALLPLILFTVPDIKMVSWEIIRVTSIRKSIFYRAILGYFAIVCYFWSLDFITMGNATAIRSLTAPIGALLAFIYLKEKMSPVEIGLLIVAVIGLVLIALDKDKDAISSSMSFSSSSVVGGALSLAAAISAALVLVIIRKAGKSVHYLVFSCAHALVGIVIVWPMALISGYIRFENFTQIPFSDVCLMIGLAFTGTTAQVFRKLALEHDRAGIVSILCNSQVIFSYLLQWFILDNIPSTKSIVGAALIMTATVGLSIRKL